MAKGKTIFGGLKAIFIWLNDNKVKIDCTKKTKYLK
jgi:hypothetical protein